MHLKKCLTKYNNNYYSIDFTYSGACLEIVSEGGVQYFYQHVPILIIYIIILCKTFINNYFYFSGGRVEYSNLPPRHAPVYTNIPLAQCIDNSKYIIIKII